MSKCLGVVDTLPFFMTTTSGPHPLLFPLHLVRSAVLLPIKQYLKTNQLRCSHQDFSSSISFNRCRPASGRSVVLSQSSSKSQTCQLHCSRQDVSSSISFNRCRPGSGEICRPIQLRCSHQHFSSSTHLFQSTSITRVGEGPKLYSSR